MTRSTAGVGVRMARPFVLIALLCAAGCGSHRVPPTATTPPAGGPAAAGERSSPPAPPPPPARPASPRTIEASDPQLAEALLRATVFPSAAAHRQVALEYRRVGVFDKAFDHFADALALEPSDAISHEGIARIWRDWGAPNLGLGAAYRAVHFAPRSASAANTLGTLMQALGHLPEAESWYDRALVLEPKAWYALNNICYVQILRRQPTALGICQSAAAAAGPGVATARNNLALALAATGDMPAAKRWFRRAGEPAVAAYNYGIALMAIRDYSGAADAFTEALDADPGSTLTAARVRQARDADQQEREQAR